MWYLELFWSFFQIGLFSIGGGYASIPLIQNQVVDTHAWLTMQEFADIMTIAEMTPGPIAINAATFVGIQTGGLAGAITATFGCILPSCMIVTILAYVYYHLRGLDVVRGSLSLFLTPIALFFRPTISTARFKFFGLCSSHDFWNKFYCFT